MKSFQSIVDETLEAEDLEELEAAADLFEFGVDKGYYSVREVQEYNDAYWKVKNRYLALKVCQKVKANSLDIISIVTTAPGNIKENEDKLTNYVKSRLNALKGGKSQKENY